MSSSEATITCPKCHAEIKLTESLAGPLLEQTRRDYEARINTAISQAEEVKSKAAAKETLLEATIRNRVQEREEDLRVQAQMQAQGAIHAAETAARQQLEDLEQQLLQQRVKLTEAQQAQAEALRKERELEGRERAVALTIEQGITAGVSQARDQARREADEAARLRLMERDQTIAGLQVKIEELAHKADVTSQQLAGEVQELDLEAQLRAKFPYDVLSEIAKGVNGADVQQTVISPSGAQCGVILWESKRTRNWSPGWLPKLREDGRKAHADILMLVTQAMPKNVEGFDCQENVWVMQPNLALSMAAVMRETLLRIHATKQAQAGMATKAEEVYAYVTGPQFRHRVEALVEAFTTLNEDLTAEKKATMRAWSKREAQLERVMTSTSGMFGDMQGIAGKALPEPEGLALGGGE